MKISESTTIDGDPIIMAEEDGERWELTVGAAIKYIEQLEKERDTARADAEWARSLIDGGAGEGNPGTKFDWEQ